MLSWLIGILVVALAVVFWRFGECIPSGIPELTATMLGVIAGIHIEQRIAKRIRRQGGTIARGLLKDELASNRDAMFHVSEVERDYDAAVASTLFLKSGLWTWISRGGDRDSIGGDDVIRALDGAYAAVDDLKTIALLLLTGSPMIRRGDGFDPVFDAYRKDRAKDAVKDIDHALGLLVREGVPKSP